MVRSWISGAVVLVLANGAGGQVKSEGPPPENHRAEQVSPQHPGAVKLEIDFDGTIVWNGVVVPNAGTLEAYFHAVAGEKPQPAITLLVDRRARYESVAQVLAAGKRSGVAIELLDASSKQSLPPLPPPPPPRAVLRRAPTIDSQHSPAVTLYYPATSRRLGEEGAAVINVCVAANGLPDAPNLRMTSGSPRLDEAALSYAADAKYIPATENGIPTKGCFSFRVKFALEDAQNAAPAQDSDSSAINPNAGVDQR
jgi:TonB family protein